MSVQGLSKNIWGFDPRSIPGCSLWLDGADPSRSTTIITPGSFTDNKGVAVDSSGNVYVAEYNNHRIRKITPAGVVTTLAGSGTAASTNGTGTGASFNHPFGLAADTSGNLYVADVWGGLIRKIVISTGVVTTLAGSGAASSLNGTGTAASFNSPVGLALDTSGNLFVSESGGQRIRQIVISTAVVTTLAGSGTATFADGTGTAASFYFPYGIAADNSGNLFVADCINNRIRKIVISTGVVTTFAGQTTAGSNNATGTAASFNNPYGVTIDSSGNIYVADQLNQLIRKITTGAVVTTLAGSGSLGYINGTGTGASFGNPFAIGIDTTGNLYISEGAYYVIRKIVISTAVVTTFAGTGVAGSANSVTTLSMSDKSSSAYTANGFTSTSGYPAILSSAQNGNNAIQFVAGSGFSIPSFAITPTLSAFMVYYANGQATSGPTIEQGANATTTAGFLLQSQTPNFVIFSGTASTLTGTNTTTTNTWKLLEAVNPDPSSATSNMSVYTNATLSYSNVTQAGTTLVTSTLYINGRAGTSTNSYASYLGELIIFSNALSQTQRQSVEGYLVWKWGLSLNLSTPTIIPGCSLWLDGADISTMFQDTAGATPVTANGQLVSRWKDKSSNAFAFITGTGGTAPTYNTNALNSMPGVTFGSTESSTTFSTNFKWLDSTSTINCYNSFTSGGSNTSIFAVVNVNALNQHNRLFGTSVNLDMEILYPWTGVGFIWDQPYNSAANRLTSTYSVTGGQLISAVRSGATMTGYSNGTSFASISTASGTLTNSASTVKIGGMFNTADSTYYTFNSNICEMLIYNRDLTTNDRQQIERYLAAKWGIGLTIPLSHPFYSIQPFIRAFSPLDIVGCQLWLDAADTGSFTFSSGSNISLWKDKSLGSNATPSNGSPVLTANSLNGYTSVSMSNAPYFTGAMSITTTTLTCFAIASTTATLPNSSFDQRLVSLENTTNVDYGRTDGTIALFNQGASSTIATWRVSGPIANNAIATNVPFLAVSQYDGTKGYLWMNGSAGTTASSASTGNFAITKYGIGGQPNPTTEYWRGYIGEVIIYNTALTVSQRQQVEGYLARKWGLSSSLISTQPFKSIPPSTVMPFVASVTLTLTLLSGGTIAWGTPSLPVNGYYWYVGTGRGTGVVASGTVASGTTYSTTFTASLTGLTTYYAWVSAYNTFGGPGTIVISSGVLSANLYSFNYSSLTNPTLSLNGSTALSSSSSVADSITGTWYFNTPGGVSTNPSLSNFSLDTTYKAIKLANAGTPLGFLSYGTWNQSTLAYSPSGASGLGAVHTVIMVFWRYGTGIGQSGQGSTGFTAGGELYSLGRSSAYNYPISGVYAGQMIVLENGAWTYGFGPSGSSGFDVNMTTVNSTWNATPGWVCQAFTFQRGTVTHYRIKGSSGSYTVTAAGTATNGAYVDGVIYIGMDQRNVYYYGTGSANTLNAALAYYGMWNSVLTSTNLQNFINANGPQFGTFV